MYKIEAVPFITYHVRFNLVLRLIGMAGIKEGRQPDEQEETSKGNRV